MTGSHPTIDVSPHALGLPPEDFMDSEDGIPENHLYSDARGWEPEDFARFAAAEDEILAWASAGGDLDSDEAWDLFATDNEAWASSIDPGLIGTVIALSVVGCCPFTSCTGGDGHLEDHPLVAFWCPVGVWPLVRETAEATGVSLSELPMDGPQPAVMAHTASDWHPLRTFGAVLVERWLAAQAAGRG